MLAEQLVMERDPESPATYQDILELEVRLDTKLEDQFREHTLGLMAEMGRIANVIIEHTRREVGGVDDHTTSIEQRLDAHVSDEDRHVARPA
jgi:hypothetical protein